MVALIIMGSGVDKLAVPRISDFVNLSAMTTIPVNLPSPYAFHRTIGRAEISLEPLGVVAAIIPWNSTLGFIASKVATAIAAGSTIVVKPSEMSAIQTQTIAEAIHAAGLPKGVINIVNGYGPVVGAALRAPS